MPNDDDSTPADHWTPLIYEELRRIARRYFGGQSPGHTLQPTALVNEAWIRLARHEEARWESVTHFRNVAALAMRQVLADYARRRGAEKRDAGPRIPLTDIESASSSREVAWIDVIDAVERLSELNARHGDIVVLRFFGGLTVAEVAAALSLSKRTVEADWQMARSWLLSELSDPRAGER